MGIYLSDEELKALEGLPMPAVCMYVMVLRRRMDFKTGMVGERPKISWQAIREWLYVEPNKHGSQPNQCSVPQLRRLKVWLERAGLIKSFGTFDGRHEGLKFLCLMAKQESYVQKIADRKPTGSTDKVVDRVKVALDGAFEAIADREADRAKTSIADKHLRSKDKRERDGAGAASLSTGRPSGVKVSELVIAALQAEGIQPTRTDSELYEKLFQGGATVEKFIEAARIARGKGKGFNYMLAIVENELSQEGQRRALYSGAKPSSDRAAASAISSAKKRERERYFVVRREDGHA